MSRLLVSTLVCSPYHARPPVPSDAGPASGGVPLILTAHDGNDLRAWRAEADEPSGAGVVILPDIRGVAPFYQRLAELFAAIGIDAVVIDYFGRTAGTAPRDASFDDVASMSHIRRTTFDGVRADIAAGVAHLRSRGRVRGVFAVGFCFGGSYAFLQASDRELDLAGAIGFYGGMWSRSSGAPTPIEAAPRARVPVLGLFGGADDAIPAGKVDEFTAALARSGVTHSIQVYPGAPHSFFDRTCADFADECADAWQRMRAFIATHTPARA